MLKTDVTKAVICDILSRMVHIKEPLLGKSSPCAWVFSLFTPDSHCKRDDANTYGGWGWVGVVTIVNAFAKVFSLLFRNILNDWFEAQARFSDYQFVFS